MCLFHVLTMNKIKIVLLLFLLFLIDKVIGQNNLIPNSGFDIIVGCPNKSLAEGQVTLAIPWVNALGSTDLYNINCPIDAGICYQQARSGNGYAGISTYTTIARTTEYMEVRLREKLKTNKKYFIIFYASPRNCNQRDICYSDALGLAFSDTLYLEQLVLGAEQIPPFTPAIQNPTGNILTDTVNWIEISGCYVAKGQEQFAIIGSFRSSANTKSKNCIGGTGSYHYIDDVGVYEYDPLPDTLILCNGETATIGKPFLNGKYKWNTDDTSSTITIKEKGNYIVNTTIGNCILSDTLVVLEMDKLVNSLPQDTSICKGEKLKINITIPGSYDWTNGSKGNSIVIDKEGIYAVTIENSCGTYNHTFNVQSKVCDCDIFVPNVFSPNADGLNDNLKCFLNCDFAYRGIRFQVFDRWGNLVYSNNSINEKDVNWDGTFNGQVLDVGVYCWFFEYEYTQNGLIKKKIIGGDVSIIK